MDTSSIQDSQSNTCSADGTIRIWECTRKHQLKVLHLHEVTVQALLMLPDSGACISCAGGKVIIWQCDRDNEVSVLQSYEQPEEFRALHVRLQDLLAGCESGKIVSFPLPEELAPAADEGPSGIKTPSSEGGEGEGGRTGSQIAIRNRFFSAFLAVLVRPRSILSFAQSVDGHRGDRMMWKLVLPVCLQLWLVAGEVDPVVSFACDEAESESALELRQLRARLSASKNTKSPFLDALDTSARCCQCSSGQVTWSVDGCKVCQDQVQKIALVSETCKEESPNFQGRVACQSECNSKLQTSGIFLQEDAKDDAVVAEREHEVVKMSRWGSATTEKCCKCKSGKVGWSASGRCSFCQGAVSRRQTTPKRTQVLDDLLSGAPHDALVLC
eukprot:s439_g18.t5